MTPPTPPSRHGSLSQWIRFELAPWAAGVVLTLAGVTVALPVGVVAGALRLAPAALLVGVLLVAGAVVLWRRALLATSIGVLALATGVVVGQDGSPVHLSAGELYLAPSQGREISGKTFRRGLGSVTLDMRNTLVLNKRVTRVRLESDTGRVLVALSPRACVSVRLRVQPIKLNQGLWTVAGFTSAAGLGPLGTNPGGGALGLDPDPFSVSRGSQYERLAALGVLPNGFSGFVGWDGHGPPAQLFGRYPSRIVADDFSPTGVGPDPALRPYTLVRPASPERGRAPVLELDVRAAGSVTVREFAEDDDLLALAASEPPDVLHNLGEGRPPEPFSLSFTEGVAGASARARWAEYEQAVVRKMLARVRRTAGNCASPEWLRDEWAIFRIGGLDLEVPVADRRQRLIAVNGLGELIVRPEGATIASGSARDLARATETRVIGPSTVRARERQLAVARLVNVQ